jgi:hypothetical protein
MTGRESPGCDMPYDVPIENAIAAGQAVHERPPRDMMAISGESVSFCAGIITANNPSRTEQYIEARHFRL